MKQQLHAMRVAGLGCGIMLAIIAYFVFTLPTDDFVQYLTMAGKAMGGGTTVGVFLLALLPTLTAFICYHLYKWVTK